MFDKENIEKNVFFSFIPIFISERERERKREKNKRKINS
jgi:hypothetical protein